MRALCSSEPFHKNQTPLLPRPPLMGSTHREGIACTTSGQVPQTHEGQEAPVCSARLGRTKRKASFGTLGRRELGEGGRTGWLWNPTARSPQTGVGKESRTSLKGWAVFSVLRRRNYKYAAHANNFNMKHVRCYPDNIYKRAAKVAG